MQSLRPQLRADAARNHESIIQAARSLIRVRGLSIDMDEIAREAGVAVGTLYRHFPAKADLLDEVVTELGEEIRRTHEDAVERVKAGLSSGCAELAMLFRRAVVEVNEERLLREISPTGDPCLPGEVQRHAEATMTYLVNAARLDRQLRADVTASDVVLLLTNSPSAEVPLASRVRWVTLALRSLCALRDDDQNP